MGRNELHRDSTGIGLIVKFVKKYAPQYQDEEAIRRVIEQHLKYRTCIVIWDKDEVIAVCRWNVWGISTAHILDLIIHPKYRRKRLITRMLIMGLKMYPQVKFISFERLMKYPDREQRVYSIKQFLRRN